MTRRAVRLNLEIDEGQNDPLAVINGIVESSRGIETSLREWVRLARGKDHSWQEIADALGVTRQSAWERFKIVDEDDPDAVIDSVIGSLKGRMKMSTDEMRKIAREEEADLERRGKTP